MDGWVAIINFLAWLGVKAILRTAYSNQKAVEHAY